MSITYVLLSPTFGMHQYTADLANRAAQGAGVGPLAGRTVRLVTTTTLPRDRYSPAVEIRTPITMRGTGFGREGLDVAAYRRTCAMLDERWATSSIVHFTGVHLWNVPLIHAMRRREVPVIQTLHDLDPHHGVRFGALIRLWNRLIVGTGCHILVHARRYREQLLAAGAPAERVTCTPLLHGFLSADRGWPPAEAAAVAESHSRDLGHNLNLGPGLNVLFFGRVEAYKGADTLLAAWEALHAGAHEDLCGSWGDAKLVIAGAVAPGVTLGPLPAGVELRDRRILDAEADALFRSASLLVLPYRDATQSALIAAAYAYGLPVIVTESGALPEYVVRHCGSLSEPPSSTAASAVEPTGWVVPPGDPSALAAALGAALADPSRLARMGAAGRAWFAARRAEEEATLAGLYHRLSC